MKHQKRTLKTLLLGACIALLPALGQAQEDWISGSLNLSANTHFISYGADVWGAGTDLGDILFNPSAELAFDLGNGVTATLGSWWDVNDNAETSIGGDIIQEVDVWTGIGFALGDVDVSLTYQEWMYANQSERIIDAGFGFPGALSPSLTIHGRVDGEDLETGIVAVAGITPEYDFGGQTVSFPLNIAGNTDEFHGGDSGFTYASAGASTSFDMGKDTTFDVGATYYLTDEDTVPNNEDDSFLTLTAGVGFSF